MGKKRSFACPSSWSNLWSTQKKNHFLICNFKKNSGHESNIFSSINLKVKCERIWKGIILYAKSFRMYKHFKNLLTIFKSIEISFYYPWYILMLNSGRYTVVTEILIRDTYVDEKQEIYKIVTLKT